MPAKGDRWVANEDLTVDRDGQESLHFTAGDECTAARADFPPQWLIDQGSVSPMPAPAKKSTKSSPAAGASEETA